MGICIDHPPFKVEDHSLPHSLPFTLLFPKKSLSEATRMQAKDPDLALSTHHKSKQEKQCNKLLFRTTRN